MKVAEMIYKLNNYEKGFLYLSVINTIVVCFAGVNYLTYALMAYLLVLCLANRITKDNFLLLALFVPNKYLQLFSMMVYALLCLFLRKGRLRKTEQLFLIYIATVGVFNCVYYDVMPLGTFFQVGVYYCIFKIAASYEMKDDYSNVMVILDKMFLVQVISGVIEIVRYRAIHDAVTGTLISAHYFGAFLMTYLILVLRMQPAWIKKREVIIRLGIGALFVYLSDAKHVWVVFAFAFVASWVMQRIKIRKQVLVSVLAMTVAIVGAVFFFNTSACDGILSENELGRIYVLNDQYNKKYVFFNRTFEEMLSVNGVLGFGVGQYGSQISLTLSKGIIYWWDSSLSAYHYAIEPYARALEDLMTESYVKYGISISSMVLGYPLVSFIAMFAELGIVGYIWLIRILEERFACNNHAFLIAFYMLTPFDTYFEIPCVLILILIATYTNSGYKQKRGYDKQKD